MRITIVNGEPKDASPFDTYVEGVAERLRTSGHEIRSLRLRDMDIKGCKGCWGCWVRTPGECVANDESAEVCQAVLHSDLTLFASPVRMGFTTALLKRATDKLIPLVHPYIVIEGGEMHHRPRYEHYPLMGLLLSADSNADAEDINITREIWERTARNMKTRLALTLLADRPAKEVADDIAAVA